MTPAIYQFILSVVGFLLVLMLGIIGFFLKKQIDATESLEKTTRTLEITVSSVQTNQNNFAQTCGLAHTNIDKTLADHNQRISDNTEKINDHSERIAVLTQNLPSTKKRRNG